MKYVLIKHYKVQLNWYFIGTLNFKMFETGRKTKKACFCVPTFVSRTGNTQRVQWDVAPGIGHLPAVQMCLFRRQGGGHPRPPSLPSCPAAHGTGWAKPVTEPVGRRPEDSRCRAGAVDTWHGTCSWAQLWTKSLAVDMTKASRLADRRWAQLTFPE